jgi:hypothetical protein
MSIELTAEEKSTKRRRERLAIAIHHWKGSISDEALGLAVDKKNLSNPLSIKREKRKQKKKVNKMLKALDTGFIF